MEVQKTVHKTFVRKSYWKDVGKIDTRFQQQHLRTLYTLGAIQIICDTLRQTWPNCSWKVSKRVKSYLNGPSSHFQCFYLTSFDNISFLHFTIRDTGSLTVIKECFNSTKEVYCCLFLSPKKIYNVWVFLSQSFVW